MLESQVVNALCLLISEGGGRGANTYEVNRMRRLDILSILVNSFVKTQRSDEQEKGVIYIAFENNKNNSNCQKNKNGCMRSSITSPQPGNAIYELDAIHIEADQLPLPRRTWSTFGVRQLLILGSYFLSRLSCLLHQWKLSKLSGSRWTKLNFTLSKLRRSTGFFWDKILACTTISSRHFRPCKRLKIFFTID